MSDFTDFSKKQIEWSLKDAENDDFEKYKKLNEPRLVSRENFPFAYPGPYSINIGGTTKRKMRRGFMRSIIMDTAIAQSFNVKSPGNYRLNFQFNPEYIERNVQMSVGAVNPLLQNPANLTQAVPGTALFNFTMMFNREAEVAQWNKANETDVVRRSELINNAGILEKVAKDLLSGPGELGVLHDLGIFDRIIGQGISSELIDIITKYSQAHLTKLNAVKKPDEDLPKFVDKDFKESINKNLGNFAFLNPMPVRIVFSDLFMVEGLVVGSAVAFQKFSEDMVPTICQVNCNVQALYVGFAKKNAYLTDSLASWAQTTAQQAAQASANVQAEATRFKDSLISGEVLINYGPTAGYAEGLLCPFYPNSSGDNNAYRRLTLYSSSQKIAYRLGNAFYSGASETPSVNYVTVPQWYNTFADGAGNASLTTLANGNYAGSTIRKEYENWQYPGSQNQISGTHPYGFLPITIKVKTSYKNMHDNTTSTLNVQIRESKNNKTKKIVIPEASGTGWILETSEEVGNTGVVKHYTYRNTFYLSPTQVKSNKDFMQHDSSYAFLMDLKFKIVPPNQPTDVAEVTQAFSMGFPATNALFYNNDSGPNSPKPVQFKASRPGA